MSRFVLFSAALAAFLVPATVCAQFAPEVETRITTLTAGEETELGQELLLLEADEGFDTLTLTLDRGSFDLGTIEVDDVIGTLSLLGSVGSGAGGPIITPGTPDPGEIECEIVVTLVDDETLSADVVVTSVNTEALDLIEAIGGSDPTDETAFTLFLDDLTGLDGVNLTLSDLGEIPNAPALGVDLEITYEIDALLVHDVTGGTLTATTVMTSIEGTESELEELFDLEDAGASFLRGDMDGNGVVASLLDALSLLLWAFGDGDTPPCMDAADVDDNGSVSALLESLGLLMWGFGDGDPPAAPGPEECGVDPSDDDLDCETPPDCS